MLASQITFPTTALTTDDRAEQAYQDHCAEQAYTQSLTTPLVFTHLVTLRDRRTEDEQVLTVETLSDRFSDVLRQVQQMRAEAGLCGYEIFEVLDCQAPF